MNPQVDAYLMNGCGRCKLFNTPFCKVHTWRAELDVLRSLALECDLTEELKWSMPVYTFQKKNIAIIGAFKDNCVISFLKGYLLNDVQGVLQKPGENSQIARVIRFTSLTQIVAMQEIIKSYLKEAMQLEESGIEMKAEKKTELILPSELVAKFEDDVLFKKAFQALTPGKQRGYVIFFTQPKQSKTRIDRIEKCMNKILAGKAVQDR